MACAAICPKEAIDFKIIDGFYTRVHLESCIGCNLCEKVCPVNNSVEKYRFEKVLSAHLLQQNVIERSSSGGVFAGLAQTILNKGGCICGACIDGLHVEHKISYSDFTQFQGSKYLQSDMSNAYRLIEEALKEHKITMFSGTPCQVSGLYRYLQLKKIPLSQLYTIEVVCHGVPSFDLLSIIEKNYKKRIRKILSFRDKKEGWSPQYKPVIEFSDGCRVRDESNSFSKGFSGFKMLRKSCYSCKYKDISRCADLTIGDFWGVAKQQARHDGLSIVLVNTSKGEELLMQSASIFEYNDITKDMNWLYGNPNLISHFNPYRYHPFRLFLRWNLDHLNLTILKAFYCSEFGNKKLLRKIIHIIDYPFDRILNYERRKQCKKMLSNFSD